MKEFADFVRKSNNSDFAQTPTWNDAVSLVGSMPSAQPDCADCKKHGGDWECDHHHCHKGMDTISRQAAIDALKSQLSDWNDDYNIPVRKSIENIERLPPAQPEIIRCKDCVYYDPPHVDDNGERREYKDMPNEAFDVLDTGLVSAEYGINVGGRCARDYNAMYSEDKRVFVGEDNYCGRAERRTDG